MGETREPSVSFRQCRHAADAVRRCERAGEVVRLLRPPGLTAVPRCRGPLTLQLYVAAREGRLLWLSDDAFGLVEPPLAAEVPRRPASAAGRWLGRVERSWDVVLLGVPPLLLIGLAGVLALVAVAGPTPDVPMATAALALCAAAVAHVAVTMGLGVLRGLVAVYRMLEIRLEKPADMALAKAREANWTLLLLHAADPDPDATADLVELARKRVATLSQPAGSDRTGGTDPATTLVCTERGVTTVVAVRNLRAVAGVTPLSASFPDLLMVHPPGRPEPPKTWNGPIRGATFILASTVVVVAVLGGITATAERADCPTGRCGERPVSYFEAVGWLTAKIFFSDLGGVAPTSTQARVLGVTAPLLGLTLLGVVVVALRNYRLHYQAAVEATNVEGSRIVKTTLLVLVAAEVELTAVVAAARSRDLADPLKRHRVGRSTVYELGVTGETRILLARGRQGQSSPGAMTTTAKELIAWCRPDYAVLTGICFGLRPGEQRPGDIVVSDRLRNLNWRKAVGQPYGSTREIIRGDLVTASLTLLDRCQDAVLDRPEGAPRIHVGLVASVETLANDPAVVAWIRDKEPDAIGGEMEGAGLYATAAESRTDWILVKGISDWGQAKSDEHQALAARAAADFVLDVVGAGGLAEPPRPWVPQPDGSGRDGQLPSG